MAKFETEKDELIKTTLEREQNKRYGEWWKELKDNAKIIDNREAFGFK